MATKKLLCELIDSLDLRVVGIYKITNPKGRVYIGQSVCIKSRFKAYDRVYRSVKDQVRLYTSIKKYGIELHDFVIIEECAFEDLNRRERYWQDFYDVIGKKGLNCQLVDTNDFPKVMSEETRKKISESNKGKKQSKETIEKRRLKALGSKRSEETKNKMRLAQLGKKNSEAHKKATSKGLKEYYKNNLSKSLGKKNSPEHIEKVRAFLLSDANPNRGKPKSEECKKKISEALKNSPNIVRTMVMNTKTKVVYKSIKQASECEHIPYSTLKHQLLGRKIYREELVQLSIVC